MKNRRRGVKADSSDGIALNAVELVTKTKTVLRPLFTSSLHEAERFTSDARIYEFYVADSPSEGDEVGTKLLPLVVRGGRDDLWASIRFDLNRSGAELWHAQIRFVIGSATAIDKICFLRLEWDPRVAAQRHAQPHWQIEGVTPPGEPESFEEYSRETSEVRLRSTPVMRPTRDYWYGMEKMHLPMAATFQHRSGTRGIGPRVGNSDEVVHRLRGSLDYMQDQFEYLLERGIIVPGKPYDQ